MGGFKGRLNCYWLTRLGANDNHGFAGRLFINATCVQTRGHPTSSNENGLFRNPESSDQLRVPQKGTPVGFRAGVGKFGKG